MAGMRDSLKQAVRQMAFRTSVDDLKKKGVQQVNVLGIDRIIQLIDEAVHRSLKTKLVGLEREAVADATKSEFLRLLRSKEDLEREKGELERLIAARGEAVVEREGVLGDRLVGEWKRGAPRRRRHDDVVEAERQVGDRPLERRVADDEEVLEGDPADRRRRRKPRRGPRPRPSRSGRVAPGGPPRVHRPCACPVALQSSNR